MDKFFVGLTDSDWNKDNNWSTSSGGSGGAGVPTIVDNVIFDGNSPSCILSTNSIGLALLLSGPFTSQYTGTLSMNGFDLTIEGNVTLVGGQLSMGSGKLTANNSLSGYFTTFSSFNLSSGTGTLYLRKTTNMNGLSEYYYIEMHKWYNVIVADNVTLVGYSDGTHDGILCNTFTIQNNGILDHLTVIFYGNDTSPLIIGSNVDIINDCGFYYKAIVSTIQILPVFKITDDFWLAVSSGSILQLSSNIIVNGIRIGSISSGGRINTHGYNITTKYINVSSYGTVDFSDENGNSSKIVLTEGDDSGYILYFSNSTVINGHEKILISNTNNDVILNFGYDRVILYQIEVDVTSLGVVFFDSAISSWQPGDPYSLTTLSTFKLNSENNIIFRINQACYFNDIDWNSNGDTIVIHGQEYGQAILKIGSSNEQVITSMVDFRNIQIDYTGNSPAYKIIDEGKQYASGYSPTNPNEIVSKIKSLLTDGNVDSGNNTGIMFIEEGSGVVYPDNITFKFKSNRDKEIY